MSRWFGLFLLLLIEGLIVTFLYFNREEKEHQVADRTLGSLQMAYNAALQTRDTAMSMVLQELVLRHDVVAAFAEGVWSNDAIEEAKSRDKLYRMLLPSYLRFADEGVLQLHFHTKDGRSYLRFHQPEQFGDDLIPVSRSVARVIETSKPVKGFEVGYASSAFRFVYPIFLNAQRLGSVEISVSFDVLRNSMMQLAPDHTFMLLIHERAKKAMSAGQRELYELSQLNAAYLVDDLQSTVQDSSIQASTTLILQQQLKRKEKVQRAMRDNRAVATYAWADGHWYTVGLLPIVDVDEKSIAYMVSASVSPEITAIQRDFWNGIGVSGVLVFVLAIFLWRAQSEAIWRLEQQDRMQTISDTMADGLYVTDSQGVVTFVNLAALSLLGYEHQAIIGKGARELFYVNERGERGINASDCPLCRVLRTGVAFQGEWFFMRKDNHVFDVEVASRPIIESGK